MTTGTVGPGCTDRGWISLDDSRFEEAGMWKLWCSVLPNPASKLTSQLPGLYTASLELQIEWAKAVFQNEVLPAIQRIIAFRVFNVLFAAGSRKGEVFPAMTLSMQCSRETADVVAAMFGALGELPWTQTLTNAELPEGRLALDLVQTGGPRLTPPQPGTIAGRLMRREPAIGAAVDLALLDGEVCMRFAPPGPVACGEEALGAIVSAADAIARTVGVGLALDYLVVSDWEPLGFSPAPAVT